MSRRILVPLFVVILSLIVVVPTFAAAGGRPESETVVYVESQGLYYDSIVGPDLPANGPFQKLVAGPDGLSTEFGPGDAGYLGGRWWLDANGNDKMDDGDKFFSCPLLGPGRISP